jgi:signal transduction histidine kinase
LNTTVGIKWRLTALGVAAGLMGLLIVLITVHLQLRATQSRARLLQVDAESFRIADLFREKLRYANDQMRHYASANQTGAWDEFRQASEALKLWLRQQIDALRTEPEQRLLKQMLGAYDVYQQRATDLHARMESAHEPGASLAEYNGFLDQSRRFMDLGDQLARAHYESRNPMLAQAGETLTHLRILVLVLVALLFFCGGALGLTVYRNLITPLRVQLVESQALAERNEKLASLGLLAAGVAHEIRTPLTAIKTALFIQQKKLQPGSAAQGEAQVIEKEISRLEHIISEFLQFARPAQPQFALIPAAAPLREVELLFAPQLAGADIRLVCECAPGLHLRADPAQIKQVLLSLVQNAADSMGHGGTITLRARPDTEACGNGESQPVVVLEVEDTGKGISPEVEKRLFDPFFTTKERGTGLGLSIAARIAEMNHGLLRYQTRVNQGSTFALVLPRTSG